MVFHDSLTDWEHTVHTHLPGVARGLIRAIAWGSFAMVIAQSCGLTSMSVVLAALRHQSEPTIRQRLREVAYAAADKRGDQRRTLDPTTMMPLLVRWVLAWWRSPDRRIALVLDATTLRQTVTVLTISIAYRGTAIPVAWHCVGATTPGAWRPHWERLIRLIQPSLPAPWQVVVMADRGLYAPWLFAAIVTAGWHPFLRINAYGHQRPHDHAAWSPLAALIARPGERWCGTTTCFKGHPVRCTLIGQWDARYADPWLIMTDLAPSDAVVQWYAMRGWIEQDFKDTKRGGWHWEQTKMTDPDRIARWWVLIAVATIWVVSVGGEADAQAPDGADSMLPPPHPAPCRPTARSRPRLVSCFRRGVLTILVRLITHHEFMVGRFIPEPWEPPEPELLNTYP